nr:cell division ATP-binding protein FtsE [Shuttleworthia satelles]
MISLEHVSKTYEAGIPALDDISLHIEPGEFVFITGASGSGKSTLIKLMLNELKASKGTITVGGQNLNKMRHRQVPMFRRRIGTIFQNFRLLPDRNVYENVAFAMRVTESRKRDIQRRVPMVLTLVGLASKYKSLPRQLSGGEQQRVAIARAIVNSPKLILADEPTGNLDNKNAWEVMQLLEKINQDGTTVVVVTHNIEIVKAMKKRVITIKRGCLVSDVEGETSSKHV